MWAFLFNPAIGPVANLIHSAGISWDPNRYPGHAMTLVVLASAWKQISYNFLFLIAGLLAVPQSVLEAAAVDGAGPVRRFVSIALPMLTPTLFFLVVVNFVYGFFETFAVVDATTKGGPARRDHDAGLQGLSRRLRLARSRLVRGAIDHPDGVGPRADHRAVPLRRAAREIRRLSHG